MSDTDVPTVREMTEMGAWNEEVCWIPRSLYPTRAAARTFYANETGAYWIEVRVLARHAVHSPDHPYAAEFDGDYWNECAVDTPGAFPVWRCE